MQQKCFLSIKMFSLLSRTVMRGQFFRTLCSKTDETPVATLRKTIYAQSSAVGRSAVAIVRISGPQAATCLKSLTLSENLPTHRRATLKSIWNPVTKVLIDRSIVVWFPGPSSYTGEDSVEIHCHGSLAVLFALQNALDTFPDVRLADAGEFTRRAYANNKLDITQVEGLADLLVAETEAQRKQALALVTGGLRTKYKAWQSALAQQIVALQAEIDFSETEELQISRGPVRDAVKVLVKDIEQHIDGAACAERVRIGCRTTFIGEPNAGKSSLLNKITQQNTAIVSPYAGTTRDVLEATLDIGGYPVTLCDTAGIYANLQLISPRPGLDLSLPHRAVRRSRKFKRNSSGKPNFVEQEGMERAKKEVKKADLLLIVVDCQAALRYLASMDAKASISEFMHIYYEAFVKAPSDCAELETSSSKDCILIFNKIDLVPNEKVQLFTSSGHLCVSSKTGEGIDELQKQIVAKVDKLCGGSLCTSPRLVKKRHLQHVKDAHRFLRIFNDSVNNPDAAVLVAALTSAIEELESLTGDSYKESFYDDLFSNFCVGK